MCDGCHALKVQDKMAKIDNNGELRAHRLSALAALARWLCLATLLVILLNLVLVGLQVALYPRLFRQPDSLIYILGPIVMLIVYSVIVVVVTRNVGAARWETLALATMFGVVTGVLWITNLTVETFGQLSGLSSALASGPLLIGGAVLWGVAGLLRARQTGILRVGLLAAIWSAMVSVLITITYGFALLYAAPAQLTANEINDPDFLRSQWHDLHAFAIANTFDAAFTHLWEALIIAAVLGAVGGAIGAFSRRRSGARREPRSHADAVV